MADVAARCGFTSADYFSHAFRRHFGYRASDLRRASRPLRRSFSFPPSAGVALGAAGRHRRQSRTQAAHERPAERCALMPAFDDGLAETELPTHATVETDVLVVGSGPAGGAAALALSSLGVPNIMITKYRWTANTPRAHITNQRAMEIFRDLGIEDQVLADATPHELVGDTVFCTAIAGEEIGRILTWGTHPAREADYQLASALPDLRHPADLPGADPGQERDRARHPVAFLHRVPESRPGRRRRHHDGPRPPHRRGLRDQVPVPDRRRRRPVAGRRAHRPALRGPDGHRRVDEYHLQSRYFAPTSPRGRASCTGSSSPAPTSAASAPAWSG